MGEYTYIDLFCGLGAFHTAFGRCSNGDASYSCVFACDIDADVRSVYYENYHIMLHGDISTIDPSTLPDFDILCAGFPCQPFSKAGVSARESLGQAHGFECPVLRNPIEPTGSVCFCLPSCICYWRLFHPRFNYSFPWIIPMDHSHDHSHGSFPAIPRNSQPERYVFPRQHKLSTKTNHGTGDVMARCYMDAISSLAILVRFVSANGGGQEQRRHELQSAPSTWTSGRGKQQSCARSTRTCCKGK